MPETWFTMLTVGGNTVLTVKVRIYLESLNCITIH